MKSVFFCIGFLIICSSFSAHAQDSLYHFWFNAQNKPQIDKLSKFISIDNVVGTRVEAYANQKEFDSFLTLNLAYTIFKESKSSKALTMATTIDEMTLWNCYPTYEVYEQLMHNFALSHPEICQLVEIGRLSSGRRLLAVKISDQVDNDWEAEPQLLYSGTIHGDELGGYVLLLRFIDFLLTNYEDIAHPEVTQLINGSAVWINPLANPDGTYKGGNHTIAGASRYNGHMVDLNRNFPDPAEGLHPDGNSWQEETQFMIAFAEQHSFSLSANFHSGAEVVNYPWDTWSRNTADNAWWRYVGGNYRDSAQANGPVGYFNDVDNGLTHGFSWYRITGGRQDFMNYFHHCREVTLEITGTKFYPTENLNTLWMANQSAMLYYLTEGLYGVQGVVTDANGKPLKAQIEVLNHDNDQSQVATNPKNGHFARFLKAGSYDFNVSAEGYINRIIPDIKVFDGQLSQLNIIMQKSIPAACFNIDTLRMTMEEDATDSVFLKLTNCGNDTLKYNTSFSDDELSLWVSIVNVTSAIEAGACDTLKLIFNSHSLATGSYESQMLIKYRDTLSLPVLLIVTPKPTIEFSSKSFTYRLIQGKIIHDSLILTNTGDSLQKISSKTPVSWITLDLPEITLNGNEQTVIHFSVNSNGLNVGYSSTELVISGDVSAHFPVQIVVDTIPLLHLSKTVSHITLLKNQDTFDTLVIINKGGGTKMLSVQSNAPWIHPDKNMLNLAQNSTDTIILQIQTEELSLGDYESDLIMSDLQDTLSYTTYLKVDTLPELIFLPEQFSMICPLGEIFFDSLHISNKGGGQLHYQASFLDDSIQHLLQLNPSEGVIDSDHGIWVKIAFDGRHSHIGVYHPKLILNQIQVPFELEVVQPAKIISLAQGFYLTVPEGGQLTDTLKLQNTGGISLLCQFEMALNPFPEWIQFSDTNLLILPGTQEQLILHFYTYELPVGKYHNHLIIHHNSTTRLPVVLNVVPAIKK